MVHYASVVGAFDLLGTVVIDHRVSDGKSPMRVFVKRAPYLESTSSMLRDSPSDFIHDS